MKKFFILLLFGPLVLVNKLTTADEIMSSAEFWSPAVKNCEYVMGALSMNCLPGMPGNKKESISLKELPIWKCEVVSDSSHFDGPIVQECRSLYGETKQVSCNPYQYGDGCVLPAQPLKAFSQPWDGIPIWKCDGNGCVLPAQPLKAFSQPWDGIPIWKCEVVSDSSHFDGPIVQECRSLYGETKQVSCNPYQYGDGCVLPAQPLKAFSQPWDGIPIWKCEVVSDSSHFDGPIVQECRSLYGETKQVSCNPYQYGDGCVLPAQSLKAFSQPWDGIPIWKCEVVSDSSHFDGPIVQECRSLYGETKQVSCNPYQYGDGCVLPAQSLKAFSQPWDGIPIWKCEVVSDSSHFDGPIVQECRSLYGETKQVSCNPYQYGDGCVLPAQPLKAISQPWDGFPIWK